MQEHVPNALKIHKPTAPASLLLDVSYEEHQLLVFSKALFEIAKHEKQPKCSAVGLTQ